MGQINCNCQQNIQKTNNYQKQINFAKINPQYDSTKMKNRVYSILKYNSYRKQNFSHEISRISPLKLEKQLEAVLSITDSRNKIELKAYYNQQNQFLVGTQDQVIPEYKIKAQTPQDQFKLIIRYIKNGKNEGNFYVRDQGIGLGCFYKLNNQMKIKICQNMLIMCGNEFIAPIFTENVINFGTNHEQQIIIKAYGEFSKSQYLYLNNTQLQQIYVGRAKQCQLRFEDPHLSNVHFKFVKQYDIWYLVDQNNDSEYHSGTWVYLNKMTKIQKQMKLKLGNQFYKFQVQKI